MPDVYLDFFFPHQFKTQPRSRPSKARKACDVKAAKALSAKYPLPGLRIGRMLPGAEYAMAVREFVAYRRPQLERFRRPQLVFPKRATT